MWQPVLMVNGFVLFVLGLSMLIPVGFDFYDNPAAWSPFSTATLITLFAGLSLFLSNRVKIESISLRQGYLVTFLSWLLVAFFAAIKM